MESLIVKISFFGFTIGGVLALASTYVLVMSWLSSKLDKGQMNTLLSAITLILSMITLKLRPIPYAHSSAPMSEMDRKHHKISKYVCVISWAVVGCSLYIIAYSGMTL